MSSFSIPKTSRTFVIGIRVYINSLPLSSPRCITRRTCALYKPRLDAHARLPLRQVGSSQQYHDLSWLHCYALGMYGATF